MYLIISLDNSPYLIINRLYPCYYYVILTTDEVAQVIRHGDGSSKMIKNEKGKRKSTLFLYQVFTKVLMKYDILL